MAGSDERTDVLLVDAYDRSGIAQSVARPEFLENARRVLTDRGVFVMNLAVELAECATYLEMVRSVFGEPVIPVTVGWGGNTVAFAGPALRDRLPRGGSASRSTSAGMLRPELFEVAGPRERVPAAWPRSGDGLCNRLGTRAATRLVPLPEEAALLVTYSKNPREEIARAEDALDTLLSNMR